MLGIEADALECCDPARGAVRLLDHDARPTTRCFWNDAIPGIYLADDAETRTGSARMANGTPSGCSLVPAGKPIYASLTDEAAIWCYVDLEQDWIRHPGKPCERAPQWMRLRGRFARTPEGDRSDHRSCSIRIFTVTTSCLRRGRQPWLAIDPKPLVGDPAFSLSSDRAEASSLVIQKRKRFIRLDRLSEELDLDRDRARLWTVGQTMAWAFDSAYSEQHFDTVRWLLRSLA